MSHSHTHRSSQLGQNQAHHSSPNYNGNNQRSQQVYQRNVRIIRGAPYDQPIASISVHTNRINITNLSNRDSVDMVLRPDVVDNSRGRFLQNSYHSGFEFDSPLDHEEKEEDVILRYLETRTYHALAPKDGVNNLTETEVVADKEQEICAICHVEYEIEVTIGTLHCGHEYHRDCIKQWLLRKPDCPVCRTSFFPVTTT
ncbi:e3 ubiquitin-protein ligase mbr1 [Nicotiana attenuata]|uniref:RING-type E3 ubiquitin transferase n=1 Tax=Nicotiana attenuata TaxID=49451 RepID=A0A314KMU4_NICAT|nr:e3 ubiquitin-protein ligase mbr1 [Nicotiana attenuata]